MDIGVVLPTSAREVDGRTLLEWGRRAEARGFHTVGVIGRVAYPTYEELVTLSALAGATERVHLLSTIIVAPTREPVLFAKQAASLDRLSGGRLVLGLGAGSREDDFTTSGTTFGDRGKRFDSMLETMHQVWRGEALEDGSREAAIRPTRGDRVPIMFAAQLAVPSVIRRMARWGDGFIAAGSPEMVRPIIDALNEAWAEFERPGKPRLVAATYFCLGDEAEAERNIRDYYAFQPEFGEMAVAFMARTPDACRQALQYFADAGFDGFNFSAAATDPDQIDRLADAVL